VKKQGRKDLTGAGRGLRMPKSQKKVEDMIRGQSQTADPRLVWGALSLIGLTGDHNARVSLTSIRL